jgi:HEAT repeat protein
MHIAKSLFVGAVALLAANHLRPFASSAAAEPVTGQTFGTPAAQRAAAQQAEDVRRASALALGQIGDSRAIEPMLNVLQSFNPAPVPDSESPPPGQLRVQAPTD